MKRAETGEGNIIDRYWAGGYFFAGAKAKAKQRQNIQINKK